MKSFLDRRSVPALAVACVALFMSLGGVSYAVATGAIGTKQIKNNDVRSADLRNNSITGLDIRDNSIGGPDIAEMDLDTVPTAQSARSADIASATTPDSIGGENVKNDSLTGDDIDESTLGKVRDSDQLGGVGAGGWQRRGMTGAVSGFAAVDGDPDYSQAYRVPTEAAFFNAHGDGNAYARRMSEGDYRVCFAGNPSRSPIAWAIANDGTADEDNVVSVNSVADDACPGGASFHINVRDQDGDEEDGAFGIMIL